jgi:flagellar basal body-associated protein FliL
MGIKEEENFRGEIMRKILKIVAMLLVVAAVVFAAGCAGKDTETDKGVQEVSNQTTPAETPAETPAITNNTENITGNTTTDQNVTHMSNTQRKKAMIQNQTKSSGGTVTVNASQ